MSLRTNPTCLVVQTRLFDVGTDSGFGKWVVFEPTRRRPHLAVGKDGPAPILRVLANASSPSGDVPADLVEKLVRSALVVDESEMARLSRFQAATGMIAPYHLATTDYPFHEYSRDDWLRQDQRLMHQYASMAAPPPRSVERNGEVVALPAVPLVHLRNLRHFAKASDAEKISMALRFALSPIGEIAAEYGPWFRRTSPSGGARHPTECVVVLPSPVGELPAGSFVYDWPRHRLVRSAHDYLQDATWLSDCKVAFVLRSRVERPMWRYRDIRSFRPVLIDAGHVAETLRLLLGAVGEPTFRARGIFPPASPDDVEAEEPPITVVAVASGPVEHAASTWPLHPEKAPTEEWLTNPFLFMTFDDGRLMAKSVWPDCERLAISDEQLWALTHAVPSSRGDRDITSDGIRRECRLSPPAFADLTAHQLLLPAPLARSFYSGCAHWATAGWYLSFLALLEAQASARRRTWRGSPTRHLPLPVQDLGAALATRRTSRAFSAIPLDEAVTCNVLSSAVLDHFTAGAGRVFVQIFDGDRAPAEWDAPSRRLAPLDAPPLPRETATWLTAGQSSVGSAGAAVWLVVGGSSPQADDYLEGLVELGAAGQRLCLSATAAGLGVFETPAVLDTPLRVALGMSSDEWNVAYAFGIGYPRA